MLKVLGRTSSGNVQKVLWLLDELKLPFEQEDIGGPHGGNREPVYLRLNPNGLVPTLIDGDFVLWESNAILRYLAGTYGGNALHPADPRKRAVVDQWMDWQLSSLLPAIMPLFFGVIWEGRSAHEFPDAVNATLAKLKLLDARLSDAPYVAGDAFSLADVALGGFAYRWFLFGLAPGELVHVRRWHDRLAERPSFQKHVMVGVPNFSRPR